MSLKTSSLFAGRYFTQLVVDTSLPRPQDFTWFVKRYVMECVITAEGSAADVRPCGDHFDLGFKETKQAPPIQVHITRQCITDRNEWSSFAQQEKKGRDRFCCVLFCLHDDR